MTRRRNSQGALLASFAVLLVVAAFSAYALAQRQHLREAGPSFHARFFSADGLRPGADVLIAGVRVGFVSEISLDSQDQMAIVDFEIDSGLQLPSDSSVTIGAPTMLSGNALEIFPGTSHSSLVPGSYISNTRSPTSLEQQISNYIFGSDL